MKLKAKCGPSTVRKKRENLEANTSISEHVSFQGLNCRKCYSAFANKELISDCPFLMCVFFVPSSEMIFL